MSDSTGHGLEPVPVTIRTDSPQYQVAAANPRAVEKAVALMFLIGLAGFAGFGAAFWVNASEFWLGVGLAVGFLGLGAGQVAWGKYLMPRGPFAEDRHSMIPEPVAKEIIRNDVSSRGKVVIERRTFLAKILGLATAVFGIVATFPLLRSLGPKPGTMFLNSFWEKGSYAVSFDGTRITKDTLDFGGMITIFPETDIGGAFSQTLLIRQLPPHGESGIATTPQRASWGPLGYLAFSKVCTHAGCPVGLYQQETHQLLCPCHQSVFDVGPGKPASNVFGPAPRPLPQLQIYFDDQGFLRSAAPYDQPVGPGFGALGKW
ncbi:MAG TPA: Rieske 2Fe-2S domain-containing protein [Acidimicrobiales bacterium]|nr:Rieske 2Fe-2S domain-containing protein [Acidimicrobiales bacterium]